MTEPPTGPTVAEATERLTRFIPYSGPQRRDIETILSALKVRTEAISALQGRMTNMVIDLDTGRSKAYVADKLTEALAFARTALAEGGERL